MLGFEGADGRPHGEHVKLILDEWGFSEDGVEGNSASSKGKSVGGGKKASNTSCDTAENIRASDDGSGTDDEEEEEGQKSVSRRVGGLCETAIDLSQDDDETGEQFF